MAKNIVRLFVEHGLAPGQSVPLTQPQAHYLFGVMRMKVGDALRLFNSVDGEFSATVVEAGKRQGLLICVDQTKPLQSPPDVWLCFAPIKKARTDFIVEKAVELGAARVCPIQTDYTNADRIRRDKLAAHAIEAAEQCGGTCVPEVADLMRFDAVLDAWPHERRILFCDEAQIGASVEIGTGSTKEPWAIFIGPEGGFSDRERTRLKSLPQTHTLSLGPRILRADTAAVAALTLWQNALGDWG
jgi:16S rRNA (uracil1498-N3)-methyltransferase